MHIAVVGCGHGEIDKIYEVIKEIETTRRIEVTLVVCCGDFQSVRNMTDLRCMACPIKYQQMHDFHRYYSGERKAPIVTIFIGGNHEASNYLQELPFGGWVAPNIYYLGYAGVVRFGNVRIAGVSGIYKGQDYLKGRYEVPPYDQGTMRSVYHYRNLDIFRLRQIKQPVDIMLSHDWPKGIHSYGNVEQLLRRKPFFRDEIERNELGSRPLFELMEKVQPSYWFSAHLHVKFAAFFPHTTSDKIEGKEHVTKFLALDKVLPRRQFLQIIEIPDDTPPEQCKLQNDPEWLAILKLTDHLVSVKHNTCFMPGPGGQSRYDFGPSKEETEDLVKLLEGNLIISDSFTQTAPIYTPGQTPQAAFPQTNPQTTELCQKIGIADPLQLASPDDLSNPLMTVKPDSMSWNDSFIKSQVNVTLNNTGSFEASANPDEISLEVEDDDEDGPEGKSFTSSKSNIESNPIPRSRLVLPPPKPTEKAPLELNNDQEAKNLALLKSLMEDEDAENVSSSVGAASSSMFFIDTEGNADKN